MAALVFVAFPFQTVSIHSLPPSAAAAAAHCRVRLSYLKVSQLTASSGTAVADGG